MALTVGAYAAPSMQRPIAVGATLALTAIGCRGVQKTATLTRIIVTVVLVALALVLVGALFGGQARADRLDDLTAGGWHGVLQSAGLLFFAFAGYARIATLGEEVEDPARTIPRAIPLALGLTLVVYLAVLVAALAAVGPAALESSRSPLATAVGAGSLDALTPAVRIGGCVAALGVLLSLLAGVSRTAFAMAADGALPRWLDAVHPVHRVPHRAELAVGALVTALVVDLRHAIGFSSFCVLAYYAIANASAWTLPPEQRRWPRAVAVAGVVGCTTLAGTLPLASIAVGGAVLGAGALSWVSRTSRAAPRPRRPG
jgi:APA family basic amino acid/polyamine antiporter